MHSVSLAPQRTPAAASPAGGETPRILVVVDDEVRRGVLRQILRSIAPAGRVECNADAVDALFAAVRMQAELVVIDAALPMGAAAALRRHLARVAPRATLLLFDTPNAPRDAAASILHWTDAPAVCASWLQARRGVAAHNPGQQRDGP